MSKELFLRCDRCGHTIKLPDICNGSKCHSCGDGKYHKSKDLYVVSREGEQEVLDSAFKMLSLSGYKISVLPVSNAGRLFSDDIVFASSNKESWGITEKMRDDYWVEPFEYVFEFFSTDFAKYDRVIVCQTGDVVGKLLKYVLSYRFEKEGLHLFEMNLEWAGQIAKGSGFSSHHATCSIADMYDYVIAASNPLERIAEIDPHVMCGYADTWRTLTRNQTGLCICEGMDVINVPVSIYDSVILDVVKESRRNDMPLIVGYILSRLDNVSDYFIIERILDLAEEGKLVLEERPDVKLSEEVLEERTKNPVQIQGVFVFPIYAILVKAVDY